MDSSLIINALSYPRVIKVHATRAPASDRKESLILGNYLQDIFLLTPTSSSYSEFTSYFYFQPCAKSFRFNVASRI